MAAALAATDTLELADRPEAVGVWDRLDRDALDRGSLASRAATSLFGGLGSLRRGELAVAEASLDEALETFRFVGDHGRLHHAAFLAAVKLETGDLDAARRALDAVNDPGDASDAARYWLDSMTGLMIAEERFEEALLLTGESERRFASLRFMIDTPALSHRSVALAALGRRDEATGIAKEQLERSTRWGAPATVGRALRTLGSVDPDQGLERLGEAATLTAGSPAKLEHAKCLLALGRSLRANRQPTEAREPLRRSLDLADRLGAGPVIQAARTELHAAGGRPRTTALTGPESLTASERRVADRAANGQSNREIAAALFVTEKTVERHLSNTYRKLGVAGRQGLAGLVGSPGETEFTG